MKIKDFLPQPGHPVAYYARLSNITGGVLPAILLCQLCYWHGKQSSQDGWIGKEQHEIQQETGLTPAQQISARKALVARGLITEKLAGMPRRLQFRVEFNTLQSRWNHYLEHGVEPDQPVDKRKGNRPSEKCVAAKRNKSKKSIYVDGNNQSTSIENIESISLKKSETIDRNNQSESLYIDLRLHTENTEEREKETRSLTRNIETSLSSQISENQTPPNQSIASSQTSELTQPQEHTAIPDRKDAERKNFGQRITDLESFYEEVMRSGKEPIEHLRTGMGFKLLPWQVSAKRQDFDEGYIRQIQKHLAAHSLPAEIGNAKNWIKDSLYKLKRLEEAIAQWESYQAKSQVIPVAAEPEPEKPKFEKSPEELVRLEMMFANAPWKRKTAEVA